MNSEVEQAEDGGWGRNKEHDEWRMPLEIEVVEEEVGVMVTEHEMLKV